MRFSSSEDGRKQQASLKTQARESRRENRCRVSRVARMITRRLGLPLRAARGAMRRGVKSAPPDRSNWPPVPPPMPPPPPTATNYTYPTMVALIASGAAFIYFKEKDNMSIVDLNPEKE